MTKTARFGTRAFPSLVGYILWGCPGTCPSMTKNILGYDWRYPGTCPGMTKTARFGTRVPQSIYPTLSRHNLAIVMFGVAWPRHAGPTAPPVTVMLVSPLAHKYSAPGIFCTELLVRCCCSKANSASRSKANHLCPGCGFETSATNRNGPQFRPHKDRFAPGWPSWELANTLCDNLCALHGVPGRYWDI